VIEVLKPGLLTTVQDLGRPGHRAFGVPVAGAMDRLALSAANLLAGNPPGAAALELTLLGGSFRFAEETLAALAGGDMTARLDGAPLPPWSSFRAGAGAVLSLGPATRGVRVYLAVRGGIDVPAALGSRSTYTRARLGGLEGRALRAGDRLPVGEHRGPAAAPRELVGDLAPLPPVPGSEIHLRVLLGPQEDAFTAAGLRTFRETAWSVTHQNDRMGYRLEGHPIAHAGAADILTDGLLPGAIQVPQSGQPIVMMADAQTTGGYAKIATVIGPDLRRLAQARAGDRVRFLAVAQAGAVRALRAERDLLARLARAAVARPRPRR
jgi:biotin-dependent carboxylase-like uncharacterized protein